MNLFIIPTNTCFWISCPINDIESYKKIYILKERTYEKPISIIINDYEWLIKNTELNEEQVEFLKNYERPFTVLTTSKEKIINDDIPNKDVYKKIAFRVAHNFIQRKLINKFWPLFLTSANKSWNKEIKKTEEILKVFSRNDWTEIFTHRNYEIPWNIDASDIIEFEWKSCNIKYLRQ